MEPASLQVSVQAKAELPVATVQLGETNFYYDQKVII